MTNSLVGVRCSGTLHQTRFCGGSNSENCVWRPDLDRTGKPDLLTGADQGIGAGTGLPFGQKARPFVSTKMVIAVRMKIAAIQKNGLRCRRFQTGAWE